MVKDFMKDLYTDDLYPISANDEFFKKASAEEILFYIMPRKNRDNERWYEAAEKMASAIIRTIVSIRDAGVHVSPINFSCYTELGQAVRLMHLAAPFSQDAAGNLRRALEELPGFCEKAFDEKGEIIADHPLADAVRVADQHFRYLYELYYRDFSNQIAGIVLASQQ